MYSTNISTYLQYDSRYVLRGLDKYSNSDISRLLYYSANWCWRSYLQVKLFKASLSLIFFLNYAFSSSCEQNAFTILFWPINLAKLHWTVRYNSSKNLIKWRKKKCFDNSWPEFLVLSDFFGFATWIILGTSSHQYLTNVQSWYRQFGR